MITCPYCGNAEQHRIVGYEQPGIYDGVLYWSCEVCGGFFHRWDSKLPGMSARLYGEARHFIGDGIAPSPIPEKENQ